MTKQTTFFYKIGLACLIEGEKRPIAGATITYALNTVPSAQIRIATGSDGHKVPFSVEDALALELRAPIQLVLSKDYEVGGAQRSEKIKLFDGYVSSPSFNRSFSSLGIVYDCENWLSDLTRTSKLASALHPSGFSDYVAARLAVTPIGGGDAGGLLDALGLKRDSAEKDVGKLLIEVMRGFATKPNELVSTSAKGLLSGAALSNNEKAVDAIAKIKSGGLTPVGIDSSAASFMDCQVGILNLLASAESGLTLFDMMQYVAQSFKFAIVPLVDACYLAPVTPLAEDKDMTIIPATEITAVDPKFSGEPKPGRVMMVDPGAAMSTFGGEQAGEVSSETLNAYTKGVFPVGDKYVGTTVFVPINRISASWLSAAAVKAEGDAVTQIKVTGAPIDSAAGMEYARREANFKHACALAQEEWAELNYRQNTMSIVMPLNTDIAPGTPVRVEVPVPMSVANDSNVNSYLNGIVTSVTISIDAERESASTILQVGFLNTDIERASTTWSGFKYGEHPVFASSKWKARTLQDEVSTQGYW